MRAVVYSKLGIDAFEMGPDGVVADAERLGYFLVRYSVGDLLKDLLFPRAERLACGMERYLLSAPPMMHTMLMPA